MTFLPPDSHDWGPGSACSTGISTDHPCPPCWDSTRSRPPRTATLDPFEVHGIKSMTIAKLVDPKAMIWRGPMAHKAFSQLVLQTDWGERLPHRRSAARYRRRPPSLAQLLPLTDPLVCTPQRVAIDDARRGADVPAAQRQRARRGEHERLGDDGKEYDIFGRRRTDGGGIASVPRSDPIHMNMRWWTPAPRWQKLEINDEITGKLEQTCGTSRSNVSISAEIRRPTLTIAVTTTVIVITTALLQPCMVSALATNCTAWPRPTAMVWADGHEAWGWIAAKTSDTTSSEHAMLPKSPTDAWPSAAVGREHRG